MLGGNVPRRIETQNGTLEKRVEFATHPTDNLSATGREFKSTNLNDRPCVDTSSPEVIVAYAKGDYRHRDEGSIIHVLGRDRHFRRPHAKKNQDDRVQAGESVDRYTVDSRYVPGPKCQFGIIGVLVDEISSARQYTASAASVEEKAGGNEIR